MPSPAERRAAEGRYYARYPITDPAYHVIRVAGEAIRAAAERHLYGRMLDIGCGEKAKAALVGDLVADHVGLDHPGTQHDASPVDIFGVADGIPVADGAFDCVLSTAVLEHLEEPAAALAEAYRVLRPGGMALYTVPLYWHLHEEPRDFFRYTRYGLLHLFTGAGFQITELSALSGFWTTFTAQWGYYLTRFARGVFQIPVRTVIAVNNILLPRLDRARWLRDERFTWMYLVVARKPGVGQESGQAGANA